MNYVVLTIFFLLSALTLGSGIMVVTVKNIIHAALWLISTFVGVAALYMLMEAEFLAIVQVLVYAGAVSILVLFAIMLTRQITGTGTRQLHSRWWVAMLTAAALFGGVIVPTVWQQGSSWDKTASDAQAILVQQATEANGGTRPEIIPVAGTEELGAALMGEYLLPFEVVSLLLTAALIGAILIAFEERTRRRRVLTLAEELALRKRGIVEPHDEEGAVVPVDAEQAV